MVRMSVDQSEVVHEIPEISLVLSLSAQASVRRFVSEVMHELAGVRRDARRLVTTDRPEKLIRTYTCEEFLFRMD